MKPIALHQLTQQIAEVVNATFSQPLWITAEVTDLHTAANGHCYMQLIEKEPRRGTTLASVKAIIWANRWWLFRDSFLQQTGQAFASGMKVMLLVKVTMHEQFGLSLQILDFDPTYTLGEMARRRMEILRRLQADGIIDMNRELPFPRLPQRIAVISANEAAGYGDFCHQLRDNQYGLVFYTHLFPAILQGQQTEASVIQALDRVNELEDLFDVVVIIRGGGSSADLASFDSYDLASCIANFPLPVITGIGHDRDQTVLDHVAHTSVKTPTAVAALLIDTLANELTQLQNLQHALTDRIEAYMEDQRQRLQRCVNVVRGTRVNLSQLIAHLDMVGQKVSLLAQQRIRREQDRLASLQRVLPLLRQRIQREQDRLAIAQRTLPLLRQRILHEQSRLGLMQQTIQMAQPDNILRRGFTITRLDGKAVKAAQDVPAGSSLQIQTADGTFDAVSQ